MKIQFTNQPKKNLPEVEYSINALIYDMPASTDFFSSKDV